MAANSLFASAVQILCVLAYKKGAGVTAEDVARSLATNPVVVRRALKRLEAHGLVTIRQGRHGGVSLDRDAADISLQDIHAAVEEGGLFALRERGNPRCPVNRSMKSLLTPVFEKAEFAVAETLDRTSLAELMRHIE